MRAVRTPGHRIDGAEMSPKRGQRLLAGGIPDRHDFAVRHGQPCARPGSRQCHGRQTVAWSCSRMTDQSDRLNRDQLLSVQTASCSPSGCQESRDSVRLLPSNDEFAGRRLPNLQSGSSRAASRSPSGLQATSLTWSPVGKVRTVVPARQSQILTVCPVNRWPAAFRPGSRRGTTRSSRARAGC